jgi:hypothetical protein
MDPKKLRPTAAKTACRPRGSDQLGSEISFTNTPSPDQPQAPPNSRVESDYDYFARSSVSERFRFPFENEFPGLEPGRFAVVCITIWRDAYGLPKRRARRRLCFCEGGRA